MSNEVDAQIAQLVGILHPLPFDREVWLHKIEVLYQRMLGQSLESTGLTDHPAYVAVHKTVTAYFAIRYEEYGDPKGWSMLTLKGKRVQAAKRAGDALKLIEGVDRGFADAIRLLVLADTEGSKARGLAT